MAFQKQEQLEKLGKFYQLVCLIKCKICVTVVGAEYIRLIWVPDTFFVNEKIALFHEATTENQFLRIMHTGEILRSMRLTIKATCPMNLAHFPFDIQGK